MPPIELMAEAHRVLQMYKVSTTGPLSSCPHANPHVHLQDAMYTTGPSPNPWALALALTLKLTLTLTLTLTLALTLALTLI